MNKVREREGFMTGSFQRVSQAEQALGPDHIPAGRLADAPINDISPVTTP